MLKQFLCCVWLCFYDVSRVQQCKKYSTRNPRVSKSHHVLNITVVFEIKYIVSSAIQWWSIKRAAEQPTVHHNCQSIAASAVTSINRQSAFDLSVNFFNRVKSQRVCQQKKSHPTSFRRYRRCLHLDLLQRIFYEYCTKTLGVTIKYTSQLTQRKLKKNYCQYGRFCDSHIILNDGWVRWYYPTFHIDLSFIVNNLVFYYFCLSTSLRCLPWQCEFRYVIIWAVSIVDDYTWHVEGGLPRTKRHEQCQLCWVSLLIKMQLRRRWLFTDNQGRVLWGRVFVWFSIVP